MKCEELSQFLIDELEGELPEGDARRFHQHLLTCAACRDEVASLRRVWQGLGELAHEEEEPSPALSRRFYALLEAYEEGLKAARRPSLGELAEAWLERWWPQRPLLQLALAAAALVAGLALGLRLAPAAGAPAAGTPAAGGEMAALRGEVASLNRLVSVTLLQQESASARLQGVRFSARSGADGEVLQTLLRVLDEDSNTNVRLSALDVLARFADRESVTRSLVASLPRQSSPLVQIALADLLLELDGTEVEDAVRELSRREGLDEAVRGYLAERLGANV